MRLCVRRRGNLDRFTYSSTGLNPCDHGTCVGLRWTLHISSLNDASRTLIRHILERAMRYFQPFSVLSTREGVGTSIHTFVRTHPDSQWTGDASTGTLCRSIRLECRILCVSLTFSRHAILQPNHGTQNTESIQTTAGIMKLRYRTSNILPSTFQGRLMRSRPASLASLLVF